jgi:hypothetical protein
MGEQIPVGAVVSLPDSTEIGFPVRLTQDLRSLRTFWLTSGSRSLTSGSRSLTSGSRHRQPETASEHRGNDRHDRETISHEKLLSKPSKTDDGEPSFRTPSS